MISLWLSLSLITLVAASFIIVPLCKKNTIPTTLEDALSNTDQLSCMPSPRGAATAASPPPHTRERGNAHRTLKCDGYITPQKPLNINKAWYLEQLQELETALANKLIDQTLFEQDRLQLQKDFLQMNQQETKTKNKPYPWLAITLTISLSISAMALYLKLGASQLLTQQINEQKITTQERAAIESMGGVSGVIKKLKQQALTHRHNAEPWLLLGRLYLSQNNFVEARRALEQAVQAAPTRADIIISLVEASYLSNDPRTESRLVQALKQAPQDPTLLNLSALILYHQQRYQEALRIWQHLLKQVPKGSDTEKALQAAIRSATVKDEASNQAAARRNLSA